MICGRPGPPVRPPFALASVTGCRAIMAIEVRGRTGSARGRLRLAPAARAGRSSAPWRAPSWSSSSSRSSAGDSGLFSAKGIVNFLEVSAQLGILAAPVALLMIAGEFDLSVGSMIGFAGIVIAIPAVIWGWPIWACACCSPSCCCGVCRLSQRPDRGEDRAAVLHRDAGQPVHAARPDAGRHARHHRPHPGVRHP